ncbi:MAG: TadE/TadG family type IV pilus assembly protein [Terracidiphilus sp.]|jgi:Flp pilus assembly protein TadG
MKMLNELHRRISALMGRLNRTTLSNEPLLTSRSLGGRVRARLHIGEEGNAILEFALMLPPLMMFLTGIASFGVAMMNYQELTHAVEAGAQSLAVNRSNTTDPCATVYSAMQTAAPTLTASSINLTVTMGGTAVNANTCSGDQTMLTQGGTVTVAATYPCAIGVYGVTFPNCKLSASLSEYEF